MAAADWSALCAGPSHRDRGCRSGRDWSLRRAEPGARGGGCAGEENGAPQSEVTCLGLHSWVILAAVLTRNWSVRGSLKTQFIVGPRRSPPI